MPLLATESCAGGTSMKCLAAASRVVPHGAHYRSGETIQIRDLEVQRHAFREAMNEHRSLDPSEDAARGSPSGASPALRPLWRDAILQPPRPRITPSAEIIQHAAEQTSNPRLEANH
jgi:hypothetical protein